MSTLIQISDPHFGTERPAVAEALVGFVAEQRPELVVLSGDITQRASRTQFAAARAFVDRLACPTVLAIPGNHDVPLFDIASRIVAPYARYRAAFGHDLEPIHRSPAWCVIGVRTTRRWRHSNGELSSSQIDRVATLLGAATPQQLRVVVVHQPIAVRDEGDVHTLLRGRDVAIDRWAEAGADLVIGGHNHVPYVIAMHERRRALSRRLWCVQAGTAISSRVRDGVPNSVNLLRHAPDDTTGRRATVERWDFDAASGRFAQTNVRTLETGARTAVDAAGA